MQITIWLGSEHFSLYPGGTTKFADSLHVGQLLPEDEDVQFVHWQFAESTPMHPCARQLLIVKEQPLDDEELEEELEEEEDGVGSQEPVPTLQLETLSVHPKPPS